MARVLVMCHRQTDGEIEAEPAIISLDQHGLLRIELDDGDVLTFDPDELSEALADGADFERLSDAA